MTRPLTALLVPALLLTATTVFTGCESANMQLPEGYAWNFSTQPQNTDVKEPRGSFRWGFNQSRINESKPTTSRDRSGYDFAAVLPQPAARVAQAQPSVPAATASYEDTQPLFSALDPQPATFYTPGSATQRTTAQGSFSAPTEIRILTGSSSSSAPATQATAAPTGPRTHTIVKGDNYWDLSKKYYGKGARFMDIQKANPTKNPDKLQLGDTIIIPQ